MVENRGPSRPAAINAFSEPMEHGQLPWTQRRGWRRGRWPEVEDCTAVSTTSATACTIHAAVRSNSNIGNTSAVSPGEVIQSRILGGEILMDCGYQNRMSVEVLMRFPEA